MIMEKQNGGVPVEDELAFRNDLLRYVEEYHWEPRITTKLLNLRYGTSYTAEEIKAFYSRYRSPRTDPVETVLHIGDRHSPALNFFEAWD